MFGLGVIGMNHSYLKIIIISLAIIFSSVLIGGIYEIKLASYGVTSTVYKLNKFTGSVQECSPTSACYYK